VSVIMMIEEQSEANDVGRGFEFALMMQQCWAKEIEQAVEAVKCGVPERKRERRRRGRSRGYWTPSGFAWFKREKWRNAHGVHKNFAIRSLNGRN